MIVDAPGGDTIELEAMPWNHRPGEHPTMDDPVTVGAGVLDCSLPG